MVHIACNIETDHTAINSLDPGKVAAQAVAASSDNPPQNNRFVEGKEKVDKKRCFICQSKSHFKKNCPIQHTINKNRGSGAQKGQGYYHAPLSNNAANYSHLGTPSNPNPYIFV